MISGLEAKVQSQNDTISMLKSINNEFSYTTDLILTSGSEIAAHFSRLEWPGDTWDALVRLTNIARVQNFLVSVKKLDLILDVIKRADLVSRHSVGKVMARNLFSFDDISSGGKMECEKVTGERIREQAFQLLDRIASFQDFFISRIQEYHILELKNYIPNIMVMKILGKLIARRADFAHLILRDGFENFEITKENGSVLIWFIGSLACHRELNDQVIPLFDRIVFPAVVTGVPSLFKYGIDAILILACNSKDAMEWVVKHPLLASIFSTRVDDEAGLGYVLKLALALANNGHFVMTSVPGFWSLVRRSFESSNEGATKTSFAVLMEIVKIGRCSVISREGFDACAMAIAGSDAAYDVKIRAMVFMCLQFCASNASQRQRYLQTGKMQSFTKTILEGSENGDEVHEIGIQTLVAMTDVAKSEGNVELLDAIRDIAEDLDLSPQVLEYLNDAGNSFI